MLFWKLDKPLLLIGIVILHIVVITLASIPIELVWVGYVTGLLIYAISYIATLKRGYRWWD